MRIAFRKDCSLFLICLIIAFFPAPVIANGIPIADSGGPYFITVGQDLNLDGSGSYVTDAIHGNSIIAYKWSFEFIGIPFATGATVTIPYQYLVDTIETYYGRNIILDSYYIFKLWVEDTTRRTDYELTYVRILSQSSASPVPEPATFLLFGLGILGLAGVSRKK